MLATYMRAAVGRRAQVIERVVLQTCGSEIAVSHSHRSYT